MVGIFFSLLLFIFDNLSNIPTEYLLSRNTREQKCNPQLKQGWTVRIERYSLVHNRFTGTKTSNPPLPPPTIVFCQLLGAIALTDTTAPFCQ